MKDDYLVIELEKYQQHFKETNRSQSNVAVPSLDQLK
jgi:hypothetical protein